MTVDENLTGQNQMSPGLLVLDFGGVVADNEIISLSTLQNTLCAYGIDVQLNEVRRCFLARR